MLADQMVYDKMVVDPIILDKMIVDKMETEGMVVDKMPSMIKCICRIFFAISKWDR